MVLTGFTDMRPFCTPTTHFRGAEVDVAQVRYPSFPIDLSHIAFVYSMVAMDSWCPSLNSGRFEYDVWWGSNLPRFQWSGKEIPSSKKIRGASAIGVVGASDGWASGFEPCHIEDSFCKEDGCFWKIWISYGGGPRLGYPGLTIWSSRLGWRTLKYI